MTYLTEPVLPYNDAETGATSGHSGSDTSKARAHALDASGRTKTLQEYALEHLAREQREGLTAREFGDLMWLEHQTYSGVMSNLHKAGKIERLKKQRKGAEVYVLPQYVNGRALSPYRANAAARKMADLLEMIDRAEAAGAVAVRVDALRRVLS